MPGYGDEVCNIINDLTTEILIKKNYEFNMPKFLDPTTNDTDTGNVNIEDDEDDDIGDEHTGFDPNGDCEDEYKD